LALVSTDRRFLVMGLELGFKENQEESVTGNQIGNGNE
jgi:hypothetical protein